LIETTREVCDLRDKLASYELQFQAKQPSKLHRSRSQQVSAHAQREGSFEPQGTNERRSSPASLSRRLRSLTRRLDSTTPRLPASFARSPERAQRLPRATSPPASTQGSPVMSLRNVRSSLPAGGSVSLAPVSAAASDRPTANLCGGGSVSLAPAIAARDGLVSSQRSLAQGTSTPQRVPPPLVSEQCPKTPVLPSRWVQKPSFHTSGNATQELRSTSPGSWQHLPFAHLPPGATSSTVFADERKSVAEVVKPAHDAAVDRSLPKTTAWYVSPCRALRPASIQAPARAPGLTPALIPPSSGADALGSQKSLGSSQSQVYCGVQTSQMAVGGVQSNMVAPSGRPLPFAFGSGQLSSEWSV